MVETTVPHDELAGCVFLSGPTAGGKTAVGVHLARLLDGEIISIDSMAVYRSMDIGTSKPSPDEQRLAVHHLIDVVEPGDSYSVSQYVADARRAASLIRARGRRPIFVGGTPLYLKALLRGIFAGPPADLALRRRLAAEEQREGAGALHARLAAVDPAAAARLHPNDTRRLIRALEVFHATGQPISQLQREFDRARLASDVLVFALDWPKALLVERIDRRVEAMFAGGLVDEARALVTRGESPDKLNAREASQGASARDNQSGESRGSLGRTASQAVGYCEAMDYLEGSISLADAIARTKTRTRQLAKRQMTWLRSLSEVRWVPAVPSHAGDNGELTFDPATVAARIAAEVGEALRHQVG